MIDGSTAGWVYGGGQSEDITGGTSVTVKGNSQIVGDGSNGSVYGGGRGDYDYDTGTTYVANVTGDTSVVIENSEVTGWVYGGGGWGSVTGDTSVTLTNATVGQTVFGGGGWSAGYDVTGNTGVEIDGGSISYVYGGGEEGSVAGEASVVIRNATVNNEVYGGGYGAGAIVGSTSVTMSGGSSLYVFGGGFQGPVTENASVNITGGNVSYVFGGGSRDTAGVGGNTSVITDGGSYDYIYSGGQGNNTTGGNTNVKVYGGASVNYVYGGGEHGPVTGETSVEVTNSDVAAAVYGGGNVSTAVVGGTSVIINGGSYASVYGGGDSGQVTGDTSVVIENATVSGSVYGGGSIGTVTGDTIILIKDGNFSGSLYGGGQGSTANVGGNTNVTVESGSFTSTSAGSGIFGGGYNNSITGSTTVLIKDGTISGTVFGGCGWGSAGSTSVTIEKGSFKDIYGGGYVASVTGNAIVNIYPEAAISSTVSPNTSWGTVGSGSRVNYWHKVKYDLNGAAGVPPTENGTHNGYVAAGTNAFTAASAPSGTSPFIAWNTKSDGQGSGYAANAGVTIPIPGSHPYGDFILYAIWNVPPAVAPTINGSASATDTISLTEGYTTAYKKQYTVAGTPTPSVSVSGITGASITNGQLSIPTGLTAAGSPYTATITAINSEGSATMTVIVNVTKTSPPAPDTGGVTGTVTDSGGTEISGVTVKVMTGGTNGTVIGSTTTDTSGNYSFSNLPYGVYSLVAEQGGVTVTKLITIKQQSMTQNIQMPSGNQNTQVEVKGGDTPSVAADNLDEMFTDADKQTAQTDTVEIKLVVEAVDNPADANVVVQNLSGKTLGFYLDAQLIKTVGGGQPEAIQPPTGKTLKIVIDLPVELWGLAPYSIIRVHNGAAKTIAATYDSDLHTLTFEADLFSTYAIAYTPSNPPVNPPVNPPNPSSNGGSSSDRDSGGSSGTVSTVVSTYWIEVPEAKTMAKTAKEKELDYVRSRRATITGIRKDALLALTGLRYQHDTVADSAVQVRIYVDDPAKAAKDILVSGYVKGDTVDKVKARFEKWFQNKVAVVSLDQQGDFGMVVQIAAKVDLSGMDTNNLYFYGYDRQANKYKHINTEYRIDANGYLHFATGLAGDIIVSNGPLARKSEQQMSADGTKYNYIAATPTLENLNIDGGDSMLGVSEPPTQEAKQNPSTGGDSLSYMNAADTPLKLEKLDTQSAGGVLVIDLDAPVTQDALSDSLKRDKVSVYVVIGITSVLLLAAMMLWAAIPRKDDLLVSVEEYRKKQ